MAIHIEWRHGTASAWTSANPVLALAEVGVETDTGQIKFGDGATAWNSLAYTSTTGPAQTIAYRSFGDGSDGSVTVSSGTTTLSKDMYYNNLTLNGTGVINTNGYKIFVKNNLDITAAQAGAIQWNGNAGGNASGATGGSAPAAQAGGSLGAILQGGAGATGTTNGGNAGTGGTGTNANGGISGAGGNGGNGTSGNGGNGAGAKTPTVNIPFSRFATTFLEGVTAISGGASGSGAGSGSGDGTNNGGGGGAGGNGGGIITIYAGSIIKSSSTPAGVIQANGGMGGSGGNSSTGVSGGGAGGGGGGGGWVYIAYNRVYGPSISALIQANGGNGGQGGSGTGAGSSGGAGGNAGTGGRINLLSIFSGATSNLIASTNTTQSPELLGTTPALNSQSITLPGGDGGSNGIRTASL